MASYILEEMVHCKNCGHDTLHRKNAKKMSWLMHLFLTVITAGLWLIVWGILFLWHIINKYLTSLVNSWNCSKCCTQKLINL